LQPCLPRLFRTTATWRDLVEAGVVRNAAPAATASVGRWGAGNGAAGGAGGVGDCKIIYVFRDLGDVCYSLFFYFPALFQVIDPMIFASCG
jgi:hypothetical protein